MAIGRKRAFAAILAAVCLTVGGLMYAKSSGVYLIPLASAGEGSLKKIQPFENFDQNSTVFGSDAASLGQSSIKKIQPFVNFDQNSTVIVSDATFGAGEQGNNLGKELCPKLLQSDTPPKDRLVVIQPCDNSFGNILARMYIARLAAEAAGMAFSFRCFPGTTNNGTHALAQFEMDVGPSDRRDLPTLQELCSKWKGLLKYAHTIPSPVGLNLMEGAIEKDLQHLALLSAQRDGMPDALNEDVVIHFRCGDIVRGSPTMGFLPYSTYTSLISPCVEKISIVTQPFDVSAARATDAKHIPRCKVFASDMQQFLQSQYPEAQVGIKNDRRESLLTAFARMIFARQSFCSPSTFCNFALMGATGRAEIMESRVNPYSSILVESKPQKYRYIPSLFLPGKQIQNMTDSEVTNWLRTAKAVQSVEPRKVPVFDPRAANLAETSKAEKVNETTSTKAPQTITAATAPCHNFTAAATVSKDTRRTPATSEQVTCIQSSGYNFSAWAPSMNNNFTWRVMTLVQFEKTQPSGFASRCDWVIGSRPVHWHWLPKNTAWGRTDLLPRTVFVQTEQLQHFHERLLKCFPDNHRFVLITGDHDATTPRQMDIRWGPVLQPGTWDSWLADKRIAHLFIEHLDTAAPRDRVTPIPLGLDPKNCANYNPDNYFDAAVCQSDISARPVRMVFTNRAREGTGQWKDRGDAMSMCQSLPHCDVILNTTGAKYVQKIQEYPFLLCVHGGGVDPNPNLFMALLSGAIPIIAPFAGQLMYEGMPVIITDGIWNETSPYFTTTFLTEKINEFAPFFEDPKKRAKVLERMTSQFWWDKVEDSLETSKSRA